MSIFNFLREVGFIFFSYFFVLAILLGGRLTPDVSYLNSMRSFYKKKSKNRHALNSCSLASSIRPGAQLWLLQIPCSYKPCPANKMPLWPHSGRRHQLKSPLYPFFFTQKKKKKSFWEWFEDLHLVHWKRKFLYSCPNFLGLPQTIIFFPLPLSSKF